MANELYAILERIARLYGLLLENLTAESHAMEVLDVQALSDVTLAKEAIVSEVWALEREREYKASALAVELGWQASEQPTLAELASRLTSESSEKLKASHSTLGLLLERCREQNQLNMTFAQSSLNRIDAMKNNILGKNNNNAENYNAQGSRNPITEHGGRLISQRA